MQADAELHFDLTVSPVDQSFLIQPRIKIGEDLVPKLVRRSYIFFVIQLRSGVTEDMLKNILSQVLQSCEEIIQHGLEGLSFVVNGQHHPVKNLNIASIKELLSKVMVVCENDDYLLTLRKTRHAVQAVAQRLHETKVTLIFFFSYVAIDHTLGKKKISYIDLLNEHCEECREEVVHLSKTIRAYTEECKCYIISWDKNGAEEEDYSLADTDLMNQISLLVGNYGSTLYRNLSASQLSDSFKSVTALVLNQLYSLTIVLPTVPDQQSKQTMKYCLQSNDLKEFKPDADLFLSKFRFDLGRAMQGQARITDAKKLQQRLGEVLDIRAKIIYQQLQLAAMIVARSQLYSEQLNRISWRLSLEIVTYKRRYQLGKSFVVMTINEALLLNLRDRIYQIYEISKELNQQIFDNPLHNKHKLYDCYSELKTKIDTVQEVLLGVFKKRIGGSEIGKLSQLINLGSVKRALKNKLVKRVNSNPYMLDQVYRKIEQIIDEGTIDFDQLEIDNSNLRAELGNCILSDYNFVKAMKDYDAMGVAFELERPQAAIADPGRIRIRQVSPFMMRTSQFFEKFIYKINYTPEIVQLSLGRCAICRKYNCYLIKHNIPTIRVIQNTKVIKYDIEVVKAKTVEWNQDVSSNSLDEKLEHNERMFSEATFQMREIDYLREKGQLLKSNYTERCDYTDRADRTPTVLGFMPLFLTRQHWRVARELMKPCLAWTATGEPLGYMFAQFQTIPFIVLSNLIRTNKEREYQLQAQLKKVDSCKDQRQLNELESQVNIMKEKLQRMKNIALAVQETCKTIMVDLSAQKYENKLLDSILKQYVDYKLPINRTVDVIANNSAFISQLYCAFRYELIPRPNQAEFHEFFIRLVEEQLRRETEGWNQEETQDLFVDKLLNVGTGDIKSWNYNVVGGEEYIDKFNNALRGEHVQRNFVELQRQELEMMLKKEGKFNDSQRLLLIEYKRLYENRVLWLWYVRFLLYGEVERPKIHKWKCVNLGNSYMLFTLIIQNKKQRKNHKRREAINNGQYADPFDIDQAKDYLERLFIELKSKKQGEAVRTHQYQVCVRAAQIFSQTGCLEEAAGTLIDFDNNSMPAFYQELLRGKAVRLDEKLKMMLTGTYRGVYLFKGWKMSKQRFWRLRERYPVEFQRYQYKF